MQSFHDPATIDSTTTSTTESSTPNKPKVFLRKKEVMRRTGLARSTIPWMVDEGRFPPPVKIGDWAIGWPEDEIDAWQEARIAERDAKVKASESA